MCWSRSSIVLLRGADVLFVEANLRVEFLLLVHAVGVGANSAILDDKGP
jgi:hypothetical protein